MGRTHLLVLGAVALLVGPAALAQPAPRAPGPPLTHAAAHVGRAAAPDSLRPPDAWIARDKALHFSGGLLLTLSGQYVLTDKAGLSNGRALPISAGATLVLGVLKEVADSRRPVGPHFSWRDLAADALGVALGALVAAW